MDFYRAKYTFVAPINKSTQLHANVFTKSGDTSQRDFYGLLNDCSQHLLPYPLRNGHGQSLGDEEYACSTKWSQKNVRCIMGITQKAIRILASRWCSSASRRSCKELPQRLEA